MIPLPTSKIPGEALKGFEKVKPMVFAGIFPVDTTEFEELRDCMDKLQLNDASLTYELETSQPWVLVFRCGFLGMLHMEIIQERLEREFDKTVITTVPSVQFSAFLTKRAEINVIPTELPDPTQLSALKSLTLKHRSLPNPNTSDRS